MELPMPATRISFADLALAQLQAATPCTSPVLQAAAALVAQPVAVGGGECTDRLAFRRVARALGLAW